jgi:hypothetical protein
LTAKEWIQRLLDDTVGRWALERTSDQVLVQEVNDLLWTIDAQLDIVLERQLKYRTTLLPTIVDGLQPGILIKNLRDTLAPVVSRYVLHD